MPLNPQLSFFLSGRKQPLDPESKRWNLPIPVKRELTGIISDQNDSFPVTYGDYFEAAGTFITKNNYEVIFTALSSLEQDIRPEQINEIKISLEKHGSFYHPSKVEVITEKSVIPFVLNVAVSETGIECIHNEFFTLKKLFSEFPNSFIPAVYGQHVLTGRKDHQIGMFLGDWFEGYCEFHLSIDPSDGKEKILIWDYVNGNFFLPASKVIEIYRQASMIMTCFYNVHTFEQIFPWHHAAGDFIVKQTGDALEVKLITVRQYAPLYETDPQNSNPDSIFEGLLIFLIVLSIRMRIDRIDGIGNIVWADNLSVEGTIKGFRDGIKIKSKIGVIPYNFIDEFRTYLQSISMKQLFEWSNTIIHSFNQSAPDIPVICRNLFQHSTELYRALKNL
jgi:hypothetical protein